MLAAWLHLSLKLISGQVESINLYVNIEFILYLSLAHVLLFLLRIRYQFLVNRLSDRARTCRKLDHRPFLASEARAAEVGIELAGNI